MSVLTSSLRPCRAPSRSVSRLCVLVLLAGACGDSRDAPALPDVSRENPIVELDTGWVRVIADADTHRVSVELAETSEQRGTGLMERRFLPPDEGMLFLYDEPQPPDAPFYMFRTRIPLDIAFVDSTGTIVATRQMVPCESAVAAACERYAPGVGYSMALELASGWLAERDVGVGDRIERVAAAAAADTSAAGAGPSADTATRR